MIQIYFNGRKSSIPTVEIGLESDHNVEQVQFILPKIADSQTAALKIKNGVGDLVAIGEDGIVGITRNQTRKAGRYTASVEIYAGSPETSAFVWNSEPFYLNIKHSLNIDGQIADAQPTFLEDILAAKLETVTKAALAEEKAADAVAAVSSALLSEQNAISAASAAASARTDAETAKAQTLEYKVAAEQAQDGAEQALGIVQGAASAETARVNSETQRATAEASRVSAENARQSAETSRAESETARQSAETGRSTAEQTRQTQEATRQATYNSKSPAIDDTQASETNPWSGAKINSEFANDRNRIGVLEHVAADFDLSYAQISEIVRNGEAARYFNIGDKIVVPWTDVADNVTYQVPHVFTHFENVTLQDGSIVPGAYLQWQYCSPFGMMFDAYEAFYYAPNGLSAGTYTVTIGANWGNFAHSGDQWNFTLTQDVPAGGRLSGFNNLPDYDMTTRSVYSWASPTSLTPKETVAIVSGAAGTALCTLAYSSHTDTVNSMQRVGYGYNRYDQSAIRQYLNSNAAASAWWTSQNDFDCPPDKLSLKAGFAGGYTDDFLTMTKPIKITTALNAVESGLSTSTDTCDTFFLPSTQQINVSAQITNESEGAAWDYWKQSLGSDSLVGYGSNNIFDAFKIGAINAQTSPQTVRLRSAYRGYAYYTWYVNSSRYVSNGAAYYAHRFAPACAIC